jgi:hypothetical protein
VEKFVAYQQKQENVFYSPNLGRHNIRRVYRGNFECHVGGLFDKPYEKMLEGEWDFAIINEELTYEQHKMYLEFLWEKMALDGLIVMDYVNFHKPCKTAFQDFCKIVSREPIICPTRYGVGFIQK